MVFSFKLFLSHTLLKNGLPRLMDEDLAISSLYSPQCTVQLDHNYSHQSKTKLKSAYDLLQLKAKAQNRDNWKLLTKKVVAGRQAERRQPT